MPGKRSLRRVSIAFPIALVALLISSPTGAQTNYILNPVAPNYIEADTVYPLPTDGVDDGILEVPLPFPFTFYGETYYRALVSTNGYINFLVENSSFVNLPIPDAATPNGAIYAFWDDLYVDASASVRTKLLGTAPNRQFVIEWRNVTFYDDWSYCTYIGCVPRRIDFEIVLSETGAITLQYNNIASEGREMGDSATIGVENQSGDVAVQYSFNTASITPNESGQFALGFSHTPTTVSIPVDIKPGDCPNPVNLGSQGVLPVAILGTADFDVTTIDPSTVTLAGVAPLRWSLEDVGAPYEPLVRRIDAYQCNTMGPDGYLDLTLKFDTQEIAAALGNVNDKDVRTLQVRAQLLGVLSVLGGTEVQGEDVVVIRTGGKGKGKGK